MDPSLILTIVFGAVVGISLGLTGGGGSIFAVPLLIYGLGAGVREAVGISLATVGATSLLGTILRMRSGDLEYKVGFIFAMAGMAGAPLGTLLGNRIPDAVTLSGFAILMLIVGIRMWRDKEGKNRESGTCSRDDNGRLQLNGFSPCLMILIGAGFLVGVLSGIFGVGGGFIIVPAIVMVTGMAMQRAIATSLMVISLICVSGVVSYFFNGEGFPLQLTGLFLAGSSAGLLVGVLWSRRITGPALKRIFAVSMWFVGLFVLFQSLIKNGA